MKDKWPVAYKVAKAYTIDTDELNKMSGEIDLDGKTPKMSPPPGSPPTKRSGKPGRE